MKPAARTVATRGHTEPSLCNYIQLAVTTWRTRETVKRDRHQIHILLGPEMMYNKRHIRHT
jgi:hypothetical protein